MLRTHFFLPTGILAGTLIPETPSRAGPANATVLPLRLNGGDSGVQAFFVEMALDPPPASPPDCAPSPDWPGRLACTADDPVGVVRAAGTAAYNATGVLEVLLLSWPHPIRLTGVYARVETVGATRQTLPSVAARFGQASLRLPAIPASPLVDLATAWHLQGDDEALAACMVLVERLRVVESAMLYATDTELTLMLRMTDRAGAPDTNRTLLWLYLAPCPPSPAWDQVAALWGANYTGGGLWLRAPHYGDGWYGVQYRGGLPAQALGVSALHATLGPDLEPQPLRQRVYGAVPFLPGELGADPSGNAYRLLALGQAPPACPWDARSHAGILLAFTARAAGAATYAQLQAAAHVIGCRASVPSRRVQLSLAPDGTLTVALGVESFLRAHDVALLVPDPARLQAWLDAAGLNLTLVPGSLRSLPARYESDPPDPATPCPRGFYYTETGVYRQLPGHAAVGPDCYGFACDRGYTLDPHASVCVPEFTPDWVYWTVVSLVSTMALAVVLVACALRILCARRARGPDYEPVSEAVPAPEPDSEPPDNTLPVGVTPEGDLLFEAVLDTDSDAGSDSSFDLSGPDSEL